MEECRIENLYNLEQTIAKDIFEGDVYFPEIKDEEWKSILQNYLVVL